MPTIPSLLGSYIDQTYQRLVQVSGSSFADGLGTPILFGGSTNPTSTYLPYNSASLFRDSFLNQPTTGILKTTSASVDIGLYLDFANDRYYLGDVAENRNSTYLMVSDGEKLIKTFASGSADGLELDFNVRTYKIGDFNGHNNTTVFSIDDDNQIIKTQNRGNDIGLYLNFSSSLYQFGDINGNGGLSIDASLTQLVTLGMNASARITLVGNSNITALGDFEDSLNSTKIIVNDNNRTISITGSVSITGSLKQNGYEVKPYKVYTALLNQTSTNPPTASILQDDFNNNFTFDYVGTGIYTLNSTSNFFTTNKTFVLLGNTHVSNPGEIVNFQVLNTGSIRLFTSYNTIKLNAILANTPIEIRVYS